VPIIAFFLIIILMLKNIGKSMVSNFVKLSEKIYVIQNIGKKMHTIDYLL
jgi:hypothetical protein